MRVIEQGSKCQAIIVDLYYRVGVVLGGEEDVADYYFLPYKFLPHDSFQDSVEDPRGAS